MISSAPARNSVNSAAMSAKRGLSADPEGKCVDRAGAFVHVALGIEVAVEVAFAGAPV